MSSRFSRSHNESGIGTGMFWFRRLIPVTFPAPEQVISGQSQGDDVEFQWSRPGGFLNFWRRVRRVASSPAVDCEITLKDRKVREREKKMRGNVCKGGGILVISAVFFFLQILVPWAMYCSSTEEEK